MSAPPEAPRSRRGRFLVAAPRPFQGCGWQLGYDTKNDGAYATRERFAADFSSWTADLVKFNIVWNNGSEGIYTGTIASDGHVTGTSVDRWHRQSRPYWDLGYVSCLQW